MTASEKGALMARVANGTARESFTFVPDDGGPERHYDITDLRDGILSGRIPSQKINVDTLFLWEFVKDNRVFEMRRAQELTEAQFRSDPAIGLQEPDGSITLVDGTHRVIRRRIEGEPTTELFVVEESLAPRVKAGWGQTANTDWGAPLSSIMKRS